MGSLVIRYRGVTGFDAWVRVILDYVGLGELVAAIEKYCGSFWTGMLVRFTFLVAFIGLFHFGLIWTFGIPFHKVVWAAIAAVDELPSLIRAGQIERILILVLQIPLGFVIAGMVMIIADRFAGYAALSVQRKRVEEAEENVKQRMAEADAKIAEAEEFLSKATAKKRKQDTKTSPAVQPEKRVYTQRTAVELFAAIENMTLLQIQSFIKPHVGKWIRVQSMVQEITQSDSHYYVRLGRWLDPSPHLAFYKLDWPTIETMSKGERIAAVGEINGIDQMTLYLDHCELVDLRDQDDVLRPPRRPTRGTPTA